MSEYNKSQPETKIMKIEDVVNVLDIFLKEGIEFYVDGGWGVDALLGKQTRKHGDLDIATPHSFVPRIRLILKTMGYEEVLRNDTREENFVLGDNQGHEIDVHSYIFDDEGNNIFGVAYLPEHLTGTGYIDGLEVKCITPEWMVKFHTGYKLDNDDYHDVRLLCDKFKIPMPKEYESFKSQK